ncbi:Hypothetical predicted protein [Lecanosticta acicola]|uniref:Uncharacterized protein n=1 Tax=Lecanosticta acicola TaxID=111012 RepID=A0AAI8Z976_9PEZI|nr:Hypothetical predicted protein [Lecanosticta acicola]
MAQIQTHSAAQGSRSPAVTLLTLPPELRLEIYDHILGNEDHSRHDFPLAHMREWVTIPREEHHVSEQKAKSYSWILSHPRIYHESFHYIHRTHRMIFFDLTHFEECYPLLHGVNTIKFELQNVDERQMRRVWRLLAGLSNLKYMWIASTRQAHRLIRIPNFLDHLEIEVTRILAKRAGQKRKEAPLSSEIRRQNVTKTSKRKNDQRSRRKRLVMENIEAKMSSLTDTQLAQAMNSLMHL